MHSDTGSDKSGRANHDDRDTAPAPVNSLFTDDDSGTTSAADEQDDLPDTPHGSRVRARMACVQALYQWLLSDSDTPAGELIAQFAHGGRLRRADSEFFEQVVCGITADKAALEHVFDPHLSRPVVQLDPVEHAILLIATYELRDRPEIPFPIVIDQACNMARIYGAQDGYRFINGVLDATARILRASETGKR